MNERRTQHSLSDLGLDDPMPTDLIGSVMHSLDPDVDPPVSCGATVNVGAPHGIPEQSTLTVSLSNQQPQQTTHYYHPGVAAVLSLVIPGAGQLYRIHILRGLLWLFVVATAYLLIPVLGVLLHIACVILAAVGDQ